MDPTAGAGLRAYSQGGGTPLFNVPTGAARVPEKYVEQDGKHKGVAGVARDVLGTLGDFLLTRLGMPAMYAPAQRNRKLGIAQQDFDSDPLGSIEQVTSLDPLQGAKMREQYTDNQRVAAQNATTNQLREQSLTQQAEVAALRAAEREAKRQSVSAGTITAALSAKTPESRKKQYQNAYNLLSRNYGADSVQGLPAPDSFSDDSIEDVVTYLGQYTSPESQEKLTMAQDRIVEQRRAAAEREAQGRARIAGQGKRDAVAAQPRVTKTVVDEDRNYVTVDNRGNTKNTGVKAPVKTSGKRPLPPGVQFNISKQKPIR